MNRPTRVLASLALAAALGHLPAVAQSPVTDDALAEIATALARIATAMEKQLEGSRLDLLMRRVETSQRRLDRVDEQLRRSQNLYESKVQERTRLEQQLANLADVGKMEALGYDPASLEMQTESLEFELELVRRQLADLGGKTSRLEEEKVRRRGEVEDWQAYIDRELTGLR